MRDFRRLFSFSALLIFFSSSLVSAATIEEGIRLYEDMEYEKASWVFYQCLESGTLMPLQKIEALQFRGACYYYLKKEDECRNAFRKALELDVESRLGSRYFPGEIEAIYEAVKKDLKNQSIIRQKKDQLKSLRSEINGMERRTSSLRFYHYLGYSAVGLAIDLFSPYLWSKSFSSVFWTIWGCELTQQIVSSGYYLFFNHTTPYNKGSMLVFNGIMLVKSTLMLSLSLQNLKKTEFKGMESCYWINLGLSASLPAVLFIFEKYKLSKLQEKIRQAGELESRLSFDMTVFPEALSVGFSYAY